MKQCRTLDYYVDTKSPLSLDLFEAESYYPAIVVQPLIGNLVYSTNSVEYAPRLAESWERTSPTTWKFVMRTGFTCESGEVINPETFKLSLERTIFALINKGSSPILSRLVGYEDFERESLRDCRAANLPGIRTEGDSLILDFSVPVGIGLIEVLSYAPFGYISAENLTEAGEWKDPTKFISSGPYRITRFESGQNYQLELRDEWTTLARPTAPKVVNVYHKPTNISLKPGRPTIYDCSLPIHPLPKNLNKLELTPEYLNSILFGNLETGYFSSIENRKTLKTRICHYRDQLPEKFGKHVRSSEFFASTYRPNLELPSNAKIPNRPLIIEGREPALNSFKFEAWLTLKKALESARIPYRFADNDHAWKEARSSDFDIRLRGSGNNLYIDATGAETIFFSMIGPAFPDPSGRVKNLVQNDEKNPLPQPEFQNAFLKIVDEDAAIIPISHYGNQIYMTPDIDRSTIGPIIVVLRFDQLEIR